MTAAPADLRRLLWFVEEAQGWSVEVLRVSVIMTVRTAHSQATNDEQFDVFVKNLQKILATSEVPDELSMSTPNRHRSVYHVFRLYNIDCDPSSFPHHFYIVKSPILFEALGVGARREYELFRFDIDNPAPGWSVNLPIGHRIDNHEDPQQVAEEAQGSSATSPEFLTVGTYDAVFDVSDNESDESTSPPDCDEGGEPGAETPSQEAPPSPKPSKVPYVGEFRWPTPIEDYVSPYEPEDIRLEELGAIAFRADEPVKIPDLDDDPSTFYLFRGAEGKIDDFEFIDGTWAQSSVIAGALMVLPTLTLNSPGPLVVTVCRMRTFSELLESHLAGEKILRRSGMRLPDIHFPRPEPRDYRVNTICPLSCKRIRYACLDKRSFVFYDYETLFGLFKRRVVFRCPESGLEVDFAEVELDWYTTFMLNDIDDEWLHLTDIRVCDNGEIEPWAVKTVPRKRARDDDDVEGTEWDQKRQKLLL